MADLPQELIDAVFEEVEDPTTLAACALTSTASVKSSQSRLFRWKSISSIPAYERAAHFISTSPRFGEYIRYLALDVRNIPPEYPSLKAILLQLPELERLSISGDGFTQGIGMDPTAGALIAGNTSLTDILSLPSLKCFALHNLSIVPSSLILRALSSFDEVVISSLTVALVPGLGLPPPQTLRHLSIVLDSHESSMLSFVLQPTQLRYLRHLERIAVVYPPVPELLQASFIDLLGACSSTLQHLELELEASLALPALPALCSLELWIDLDLVKTPLLLASIVFETIAALPHLEVLTISFLDRPKTLPQKRYEWKASRAWDWADLDATFVDAPELREVHFALRHFLPPEAARHSGFIGFIQEKLPRTMDAGLLWFSQGSAFPHPMDRFGKD
ncbi:hypothetical protein DFH09DRAFT_1394034 [Mycena vulgaris]|nr:hypothetical protein DFH09DRAFT_1394034 [Mycena vulgaris]